jgi:ADP-heptose:LPS heptosyltransferase
MRGKHPGARIRVIGYPDVWQVAGDLVDDRVSIDSQAARGLFAGDPDPSLVAMLRRSERVVMWSSREPNPELHEAGLSMLHASPYPPPGTHAAAWLLQTVGLEEEGALTVPDILGLKEPHPDAHRPAGLDELGEAATLLSWLGLRRPVFVHPGAGADWKRWPADRFAALVRALLGRGEEVALVEGPADAAAVSGVRAALGAYVPVLRNLPVRSLAAVLSQGSAFVGNDSGVTHLAAAAGMRTIALFGPTDPVSWAPLGDVRVIRHCVARTTSQGQIRVCGDPCCLQSIRPEECLE